MPKRKQHRNYEIIRLHAHGASLASLASQFDLSEGRIRTIIEVDGPVELLKNELRAAYGDHPNLNALPDETPIDILLLHDTDDVSSRGLLNRLKSYEPQIRDLGDLRRMSKRRLLAVPRIGPRTLAALRDLCSPLPRWKRRKPA
ncbi:MAG: hypothetical protein ABWY63_02670 [Hyphomicrobiaceae bacterium]|jgi:hypothetical protein